MALLLAIETGYVLAPIPELRQCKGGCVSKQCAKLLIAKRADCEPIVAQVADWSFG